MKTVSEQYTMTRYRLTIGSWLLVTENSGSTVHLIYTGAVQQPLGRLWLDYGAIAMHRNYLFADKPSSDEPMQIPCAASQQSRPVRRRNGRRCCQARATTTRCSRGVFSRTAAVSSREGRPTSFLRPGSQGFHNASPLLFFTESTNF
jgi:hypothetical protein